MDYSISKDVDADMPTRIKWSKQREKRGFDDTELWNLDVTISKFLVPRLKAFKRIQHGWPPGVKNMKSWKSKLDKMIDGFSIMDSMEDKDKKKQKVAIELLCKYYQNLWD